MARQATNQAQKTYKEANNLEGASLANSNALYSQLDPIYQNEAVNPQGFNPKEMSDFTTSAEQSAGGALGAATGKATQLAAANRNSGSFAPVLDEASRASSRNLSKSNLDVQNENAMLKEKQRQEGISGLGDLNRQQNADVLASLGLENESTNALTNAGKSGWFQNMEGLISALSGAGASKSSNGDWAVSA